MNYFIAIHVHTTDHSSREERGQRVNIRTEYIRAFNKKDADTVVEVFNSLSDRTYRSGPFEHSRSAEVVTYIRDAKGRGIYLTMSDVKMLVSDYLEPDAPAANVKSSIVVNENEDE